MKPTAACRTRTVAASILSCLAAQQALAAPPTDACSLLTQTQVSMALGVPVDPGKTAVTSVCQWVQPGKPGADLLKLDVTFLTMEQFNTGRTMSGNVTSTPVVGLGDNAYYYAIPSRKMTTLHVKKGNVALSVRVWGGKRPLDQIEAKEKAVVQAILAKL